MIENVLKRSDDTENKKASRSVSKRYYFWSSLPKRLIPRADSTSRDPSSSELNFFDNKALKRLVELSGASANRPKQDSSQFKHFADEIFRCSQKYFPDLSLQSEAISKAYELYQIGRRASQLGFTVLGRILSKEVGESSLSNEKFPFIDSTLRQNLLGQDKREKSGIILRIPDEDWNMVSNFSWLLGLIHASTQFNFASQIVEQNLWDSEAKRARPFAAELKLLLSSGYELYKTPLEVIAICTDKKKAQAATLRTLIEATQPLYDYDKLKAFYQSLPDEVKSKE